MGSPNILQLCARLARILVLLKIDYLDNIIQDMFLENHLVFLEEALQDRFCFKDAITVLLEKHKSY